MELVRRSAVFAVIVAATAPACSTSTPPAPAPAPPLPVVASAPTPAPQAPAMDPSGMHLDDYTPGTTGRAPTKRLGRPIEVMLRSTPAHAYVAVDGVEIGAAPQMWQGLTGEHEFTFRLPGHALARYRFHVITTGLVHARLEPVAHVEITQPPPPEVVPPGAAAPSTIRGSLDGSPRLAPDAGTPTVPPPIPPSSVPAVETTPPPSSPGLGPQF